MAKFCTECGKEISAGVAFCPECGAKIPDDPVQSAPEQPIADQPVSETPAPKEEIPQAAEPQPQAQPEAERRSAPPEYQRSAPPSMYQQPAPMPDPTSKVVGTGAFFGLMFLFALPIIGLIACIIMCFAPKNKNIKHFARAVLIWYIIMLVIVGLLVALVYLLSNTLIDYINQITDGQFKDFGDIFDSFGEFGDTMDELGNLTEQFENGGLTGLPIK